MRGSIRKRVGKRGVYYDVVFDIGRDPVTGKRKQKWLRGFRTKKEAEAALAQAIAEVERGTYIDPEKVTLAEYLKEWHAARKHKLSLRTWERYGQLIEHWLIPHLGGIPLRKLSPVHLEKFISAMLEADRLDGKGKISPTTVRHAALVLNKALRDAVKKRLIPYNPMEAVDKPRKARKEPPALKEGELRRLMSAAEGTYLYAPITLAVYTGARLGEILGLRWRDVDFEAGCIFILQALKRNLKGELYFDEPKTPRSRRRIEIGPACLAALRKQKKLQAEWKLKAGSAWQETGLVCTREDGSPIDPHAFSSAFRKLASKLGIDANFHALRHTHATMLLKAGVHLKIVSERLGHASVAITGDLYSHVLPGMQGGAAQLVEEELNGR
ncbi:integrase family protein [Ammonifex degensii KC4]|uniref:Integrase family protein n=1 Tax=Ammonifex degensii (strain DSM 10501 / KC4) TaxID=429009 RepID=C9RA80_AMMDK|nr:tyrosine-type recombinase/integrase [Ammonifex degensii]ACX51189.1 integrase family protein [Ammonifex degensii KC4]